MRAFVLVFIVSLSTQLYAQSVDSTINKDNTEQSIGLTIGVPKYNYSKSDHYPSNQEVEEIFISPQITLHFQRPILKNLSARIGLSAYSAQGHAKYSMFNQEYDYSYVVTSLHVSALYNYYISRNFLLYAKVLIGYNLFWYEAFNRINIENQSISNNMGVFFNSQNIVFAQLVPLAVSYNASRYCNVFAEITPRFETSNRYNRFSNYKIGVNVRL